MNQLQSLLQDSLIATGHVEHCAIIRRKDFSLRAISHGSSFSARDIEEAVMAFKHPTQTREDGLLFNGVKYKCVRADKFSIYSKKDDCGIILVKTATLVLVGVYNKDMYPSICVEAVEHLADYFREKGK